MFDTGGSRVASPEDDGFRNLHVPNASLALFLRT